MSHTPIYFASDHAGIHLRITLLSFMQDLGGWTATDLGPTDSQSVDYPDYAAILAARLRDDPLGVGVLVCGSGIGISMAANRFSHIRAALVHDVTSARLSRQHNDANVIAFGERLIGTQTACDCLDVFLTTAFEGGRHQRRVDKLTSL